MLRCRTSRIPNFTALRKVGWHGAIHVRNSMEALNQSIRQDIVIMASALIIVMVLSYGMASHLQRVLSDPIVHLAAIAETVSTRGDYSLRVDKGGRDEVGVLCDGFNQMLEQIEQRGIQRDKVEEALRASEERYRTLFNGVPVGLYRSTPDGRYLDANDAMAKMLGYSSAEGLLSANPVGSYASPAERAHWQELLDQIGEVSGFVSRHRRRDETEILMEEFARAVAGSNREGGLLRGHLHGRYCSQTSRSCTGMGSGGQRRRRRSRPRVARN